MIQLGMTQTDPISGFTGVVVGRSEYLNGCVRYLLMARKLDNDGKPQEQWFDEEQLEGCFQGDAFIRKHAPAGGPERHAPPSRDPMR